MAIVGLAAFSCTFPDYQFGDEDTETCDNKVLDGTETRIDCGGDCDPCPCSDNECPEEDQVCVDGTCQDPCVGDACDPTCSDDKKNGNETAVDCGGTCPACPVGTPCLVHDDCIEKVCEGEGATRVCQPPTCHDGVKNPDEAWVDCDANCPNQCENGEPCDGNSDCISDTCVGDKCVVPLCENHEVDPDETDEDCGGDNTGCLRCEINEGCREGDDCVEHVCGSNDKCAEPACDDDVTNGKETDKDCGGATTCDRCGTDAVCKVGSDCRDQICNEDKKCEAPSCDDEFTNGDESDLNCGGETGCDRCPLEAVCNTDGDCESVICDLADAPDGQCVDCSDEQMNGSELGFDCGGEDCPLCEPNAFCTDSAGCVNYLCANEKCTTGLAVDYLCDHCGNADVEKIHFLVWLRNLSDEAIDVSDVLIRYYLSAEITEDLSFDCTYQDMSGCGEQRLAVSNFDDITATHYFETRIGSTTKIPANSSATVEIRMDWLNNDFRKQDQGDDYSFNLQPKQVDFPRITLHRAGWRIWGTLPE